MTDKERKEMCEDHYGLIDVVVDEFLSRKRNRQYQKKYREDMYDVACVTLVKASKKFDPLRGFQFDTYASNSMRYEMIRELRKIQLKLDNEHYIEDIVDTDLEPSTNGNMGEEDFYAQLIEDSAPENDLDRHIYLTLIVGDYSKQEVAEEIGSTSRKVGYMKKRVIKNIKNKLEKTK